MRCGCCYCYAYSAARDVLTSLAVCRYQVSLQLTQLDGLVAGYNAIAPPDQFMQYMTHLLNNYIGDYGDVVKATNRTARPAWHSMTAEQVADARMENEHCSGLIKVTDDASDLFVAHNTWGSYQSMLRIFKTYALLLCPSPSYASFLVCGYLPVCLYLRAVTTFRWVSVPAALSTLCSHSAHTRACRRR